MGISFLIGKTGHGGGDVIVSAKVGEILPKQSCAALSQSNFSVAIEDPRNNSHPCLLYPDNSSQYPEKEVKGPRKQETAGEKGILTDHLACAVTGNNKSSCKWKDGRAPKNCNHIPEGGGLLKIGYEPGAID